MLQISSEFHPSRCHRENDF